MGRERAWWKSKEYAKQGEAYRNLCRRLDQVDITVEQFEAEVETMIGGLRR
jgi:hypothetical protein